MADETPRSFEEIEKQILALESELEKMGAKGGLHYPNSDDADMTGDGKSNTKGHSRRVKLHKAKKKPMVDDSADDGEPEPDADDDGSGDDWSDKGSKAKAKKAADDAADEPVAKAEGESVTIEGQTFYKSLVGDASFALIKGQAEKVEKALAEVAKERDLRVTAEFQKRASELYKHLPPQAAEMGAVLKAVETLPEDVRKSITSVFDAHEKMAKMAFDKVGINPGDVEKMRKNAQGFQAKVAEIKKRDNCSNTEAMQKARAEDPEGFTAYQGGDSAN